MSRVSSHFFFFGNIFFPSPFTSLQCGAVFLQRNTCYWAEPAHEDATLWYGRGSRSCILHVDALLGGARRRNSKRAEAQWGVNEPHVTNRCARGAASNHQSLSFCWLCFGLPPFFLRGHFSNIPSCCLCSHLDPCLPRIVSLALSPLGILLLLCHWEAKRC